MKTKKTSKPNNQAKPAPAIPFHESGRLKAKSKRATKSLDEMCGIQWLVAEGNRIYYQGSSCKEAIDIMHRERINPRCLFTSSFIAGMLLDMLPKTS